MEVYGCHKQHMSCKAFWNCHGGQDCLTSCTATMEIQSAEEEIPTAYVDSNLPDDCDDEINP